MAAKNKPKIKSELTTLNNFKILFNLKILILIKEFIGIGPVKRYKGFIIDSKNDYINPIVYNYYTVFSNLILPCYFYHYKY